MPTTPAGADETDRLRVVRDRVRELAREHDWFADAIRAAFADFIELNQRFVNQRAELDDRERRLARDLLESGRLRDPKCGDNRPCLSVSVIGLCPSGIAKRLEKHGRLDGMPAGLEREGARAAVKAMDRHAIYHARDLSNAKCEQMWGEDRDAIASGKHVNFSWTVDVSRPADWTEPADPHSLKPDDLGRFTEAEYRTIALHHLGGLADAGALRPIVRKPQDTGDMVTDVVAIMAWRERLPIRDEDRDSEDPPLRVGRFPPAVAEQMLAHAEHWVRDGSAAGRRGALAGDASDAATGESAAASTHSGDEGTLVANLATLGVNLRASPASSTIRLIADVVDAREKGGAQNIRHCFGDDGTPPEVKARLREELLKQQGGGVPSNGAEALIRLRHPPTAEDWATLIRAPFNEWLLPTIAAAERGLRAGAGRRLNAEGHSATTVGADLGKLRRLVELFLGLLPEAKPFPPSLPNQFAAVGARLERAAELLRAAIDYSGPDGGHADPGEPGHATRSKLTDHPAGRLLNALLNLSGLFHDASSYREIAQRRRAGLDHQKAYCNRLEKTDPAKARAEWDKPPRDGIPGEWIAQLSDRLKRMERFINDAREAVNGGGAAGMDAAFGRDPEGRPRSLAIGVRLREADELVVGLRSFLSVPSICDDSDAGKMESLRDWFAGTQKELSEAIGQRGLDAPIAVAPVALSPEVMEWLRRASAAPDQTGGEGGDPKGRRNRDGKTMPPLMERPVVVADAARAIGKRSDVVLRALRARSYKVEGLSGSYTAELDHIISTYPRKKKLLLDWANKNYPID